MTLKKSVSKRFKITKAGKLKRRFMASDHFRTRKSTNNLRGKRKRTGLDYPAKKILNY